MFYGPEQCKFNENSWRVSRFWWVKYKKWKRKQSVCLVRRHWIKRLSRFRPDKSPPNEISIRETNLPRVGLLGTRWRKEGKTGVQAGGQDGFYGELGRDRTSSREPLHLRNLCEPWHRFRGAARVDQRLRYRRKADLHAPKPTATTSRVLFHTRGRVMSWSAKSLIAK